MIHFIPARSRWLSWVRTRPGPQCCQRQVITALLDVLCRMLGPKLPRRMDMEDLEGYGLGQWAKAAEPQCCVIFGPRETRHENLTDGPAVDFANPFPPKRVPPETSGGLWGIFMDIHYWGCLCFCRVSTKFRPHIICWWLFWQTLELAHQHLLSMKSSRHCGAW